MFKTWYYCWIKWQYLPEILMGNSLYCFSGSLTALVCQHSITPLALPCKLILPDRGKQPTPSSRLHFTMNVIEGLWLWLRSCQIAMVFIWCLCFPLKDPLEDVVEATSQSVTNSAAELLKQGAGNQLVLFKHHHKSVSLSLYLCHHN